MNHIERLGDQISVQIEPDEAKFTGRECPQENCEGYFKIEFGTGLKGEDLPCHCPYCGHTDAHDTFWTREQIDYAKSIVLRKITDAFVLDLKQLEFEHRPRGGFGIGLSLKVEPGSPTPIHHYRERQLETEVICANCTLRYAVYGVFAFCPDCGQHNSLQILKKNFEIVHKMLNIAGSAEAELQNKLTENALEDCVSSFDAFGRELCRVYAKCASNPERMNNIRFQNLNHARTVLQTVGINITEVVSPKEWEQVVTLFQKRHLVAHKLGVVDQEYVDRTADSEAVVGRKIRVSAKEVTELNEILWTLAESLMMHLNRLETIG